MSVRWLGAHLSPSAKERFTYWLAGAYESSWSTEFCKLFDAVFGEKHFSLKCFLRSSLASIASVIVIFLLFDSVLGVLGTRTVEAIDFWDVVIVGAVLNIVPDYLSLIETRYIIGKIHSIKKITSQLIILFLDILFTGIIISIIIVLYTSFLLSESVSIAELMGIFSRYSLFFYSTFFTSVLVWIYLTSTWFMRIFSRTPIFDILNTEKEPIHVSAFVGSVVILSACMLLKPVIEPTKDGVPWIDEQLCEFNPELCKHVLRMSDDEKQALRHLITACLGSNDERCVEAGDSFSSGNTQRVFELWKSACADDIAIGCSSVGYFYLKGLVPSPNEEAVMGFFERGCSGGYLPSCINLAGMLVSHSNDQEDIRYAFNLYKFACDNGSAHGCSKLGTMFEHGRGATQDYFRAGDLYQLSCNLEFLPGCVNLGLIYESGLGRAQNFEKAVSLYTNACRRGAPSGCGRLGDAYMNGRSVMRDPVEATKYFGIACDGGFAPACTNLAFNYRWGRGVKTDRDSALHFYKKACDLGQQVGCDFHSKFSN